LRVSLLEYVPRCVLGDPGCVVDVGANVGVWSEAVLDLLGPRRLIAVEPSPANFSALKARIGLRSGVVLHMCAAGSSRVTEAFNVYASGDLDSLLPIRPEVGDLYGVDLRRTSSVEVEVRTLDELLCDEPEIGLLKIDVQGSESAVLSGAGSALLRTKAVLLEMLFVSHYEGDVLFFDLNKRLADAGFSFFAFALPLHRDLRTGRLLFADAVYINERLAGVSAPSSSRSV